MTENLCLPAGWKRGDALDDARRALIRAISGLKNASSILKVWGWIAERKTLKSSNRQWNLPRQILAEFTRTLGLTENQIRGALRWLVEHDWLGRDGKKDPATGRWKCLRILNPRYGHKTCVPIRYHLGARFLNFFPKALFSFFRHQYVATLQENSVACATGEVTEATSGCKRSWFTPQVEEVMTEAQQAAENEVENTKLNQTIGAALQAVKDGAKAFFRPRHPAANRLGRVLTGQATPREVEDERKAHGLPKPGKDAPKPYERAHRPLMPDPIGPDAPPDPGVEGAIARLLAMMPKPSKPDGAPS